jgi:sucrose-6F-phosphate phosphohydrolase
MPEQGAERLPSAERWLLVTDIDDTLLGDDEALRELLTALRAAELPIALNSSRPTASVRATIEAAWPPGEAPADAVITALGTEIHYPDGPDEGWQQRFGDWPRDEIDGIIRGMGFEPHRDEFQTRFKASYVVPASEVARVEAALEAANLPRRTIHSGTTDYDVIPPQAGKAEAMFRVAETFDVSNEHVVVSGDSGNDLVMFEHAARGIVVGNARAELRDRVDRSRAYLARGAYAAGILEGLRHWALVADGGER